MDQNFASMYRRKQLIRVPVSDVEERHKKLLLMKTGPCLFCTGPSGLD